MYHMIDELSALSESDIYPFHMPGHKRRGVRDLLKADGFVGSDTKSAWQDKGYWLDEAYAHDITEIDGFDDLQKPDGIIADIEERIAAYYGFDRAFLSVNGSTCGNLSAISALVPHGGCLMMDEGCHRSVYNAVKIRELKTIYLERETIPESDLSACISLGEVKKKLSEAENKNMLPAAVLITSPTYEGFIADVSGIADAVHEYGIPLIIDGAHGAHFTAKDNEARFPMLSDKADIIVVSLHKTLPAMTQVSAVLINGKKIDHDEIKRYINIYQTTSPSYILIASAERCLDIMEETEAELKNKLIKNLNKLYSLNDILQKLYLAGCDYIGKYGVHDFDRSKVNVMDRTGSLTGRELYDFFRTKYYLQPEKCTDHTCLMLTTVMDTEDGFNRLTEAIKDIDSSLMTACELPG